MTETLKQLQRMVAKRSTMLVQAGTGSSYANDLGKLRKKVEQGASHTRVVGKRPTKEGDLFMEIGGPSNKIFENKITRIADDMVEMKKVDQNITLEIRNL